MLTLCGAASAAFVMSLTGPGACPPTSGRRPALARACRPPQYEPRRTKVAPHLQCSLRPGIRGDAHAEDSDFGRCRDVFRGIQRGCARTRRQRGFGRTVRSGCSGARRRRCRRRYRLHRGACHCPVVGTREVCAGPPSARAEPIDGIERKQPCAAGRAA